MEHHGLQGADTVYGLSASAMRELLPTIAEFVYARGIPCRLRLSPGPVTRAKLTCRGLVLQYDPSVEAPWAGLALLMTRYLQACQWLGVRSGSGDVVLGTVLHAACMLYLICAVGGSEDARQFVRYCERVSRPGERFGLSVASHMVLRRALRCDDLGSVVPARSQDLRAEPGHREAAEKLGDDKAVARACDSLTRLVVAHRIGQMARAGRTEGA